jgi:hypothetical protein
VTTFVSHAPRALVEALERRAAKIAFHWEEDLRAFARASSADGELFARYSGEPADVIRLQQEGAVRTLIGDRGALRTPPVLESGPGWMLERAVSAEPWSGRASVDAAVLAAAEIPELDLPAVPGPAGRRSPAQRLLRIARAAMGPISVNDLRTARRELAESDLPRVSCHRDFHPKNVLFDAQGSAWVIDWERTGPGPLGLDLMQLWANIADPEDRERLFEHAVELVGAGRRASLERLRFAVVVAEASGWHAERNPYDRDDAALARMLEVLPELRPAS